MGSLGAPLDPLGALSGPLGDHLGFPRRRFGALLSICVYKSIVFLKHTKQLRKIRFLGGLGLSWGSLEALLGLSRRSLGVLLGYLGSSESSL